MGKCKDCKYWEAIYSCYQDTYHVCSALHWTQIPEDVKGSIAALHVSVDDDTGLNVDLVTGPDFGCTRFEQKEVKKDEVSTKEGN